MAPSKPKPADEPTEPALAAVPDPEPAPEKESTVRQRLMGQAMIALRESHREEFDQIARELFAKEGLTYKRRLSEQERASEKIIALARANGLDVTLRPAGSTD
jgi:hypothetical protein